MAYCISTAAVPTRAKRSISAARWGLPGSEGLKKRLMGIVKHFLIAPTVAVGGDMTFVSRGQEGLDATHFLGTVAVGRGKSTRESAVAHLYLRSHDMPLGQLRKEWPHPGFNTGTDDEHHLPLTLCSFERLKALRPQQMTMLTGKCDTELAELRDGRPCEEEAEEPLLGSAIGIEV